MDNTSATERKRRDRPALQFLLLAIFFFLAAGPSWALDPRKEIGHFIIEHWATDNSDIPQNSVLSLLQTRDGYLWSGTYEGLCRFDGRHFTVFDKSNTPEIRNNGMLVMAEGRGRRPVDRHAQRAAVPAQRGVPQLRGGRRPGQRLHPVALSRRRRRPVDRHHARAQPLSRRRVLQPQRPGRPGAELRVGAVRRPGRHPVDRDLHRPRQLSRRPFHPACPSRRQGRQYRLVVMRGPGRHHLDRHGRGMAGLVTPRRDTQLRRSRGRLREPGARHLRGQPRHPMVRHRQWRPEPPGGRRLHLPAAAARPEQRFGARPGRGP